MVDLPTMTCIICHVEVPNVGSPPYSHLQPMGGTLFTILDHYGSGVFDPGLHVVICDGCMRVVARQLIWSEVDVPPVPAVRKYEIFDPEEHG